MTPSDLTRLEAIRERLAKASPGEGPATPGTDDPGRPITPEDTLKCTEGGPEGPATAPGAGPASKVCNLGEHAACVWLLCACACHGAAPPAAGPQASSRLEGNAPEQPNAERPTDGGAA